MSCVHFGYSKDRKRYLTKLCDAGHADIDLLDFIPGPVIHFSGFRKTEDTLKDLKALFNNAPDLAGTIRKYIEENAGLKKQMEDFMREKEAQIKERLLKNMQEIHGIKVIKICAPIPAESIKNIAFQLRGEITENLCFVAGTINEGKPMLTVMLSDNLVAGGLKAGNLVKEAAKLIQGGGGGQPHFATAGGKNIDGLNAAIEKVLELAGI